MLQKTKQKKKEMNKKREKNKINAGFLYVIFFFFSE